MSPTTHYQAQVSAAGGAWRDQGPAMKVRMLVEANVDGYREQAAQAGLSEAFEFRIVEVQR